MVAFGMPIKVLPLHQLGITTGVADECIRYIDSCGRNPDQHDKKCNILLCGEHGTGKLSLVKALALHYKKPLTVMTLRANMPTHLLRDNVPNNSILCLRDADTMGPLIIELLESQQFRHRT